MNCEMPRLENFVPHAVNIDMLWQHCLVLIAGSTLRGWLGPWQLCPQDNFTLHTLPLRFDASYVLKVQISIWMNMCAAYRLCPQTAECRGWLFRKSG